MQNYIKYNCINEFKLALQTSLARLQLSPHVRPVVTFDFVYLNPSCKYNIYTHVTTVLYLEINIFLFLQIHYTLCREQILLHMIAKAKC